MLDQLQSTLEFIDGKLWGDWLMFVLLGVGVLYTIVTGAVQVRHFGYIIKKTLWEPIRGKKNGEEDAGGITSFLDRAFYADLNGGGNRFTLKPAATVISARRAGTTATWDQLNKYFGLMQMPIITSRYWNMVHGTNPDEVRQDLEGMQVMRVLGRNMAFFLKCKQLALQSGLRLPEQEPFQFTNFIRG